MLPASIVFVTVEVSAVVIMVPLTSGAVSVLDAVRVVGTISTVSDVVPPARPRSRTPSWVAAWRKTWPVAFVKVLAPVKALLLAVLTPSAMPYPLSVVGLLAMFANV